MFYFLDFTSLVHCISRCDYFFLEHQKDGALCKKLAYQTKNNQEILLSMSNIMSHRAYPSMRRKSRHKNDSKLPFSEIERLNFLSS
mmetsp:Transcript_21940/g.45705  ORF Transcript_21940/g.45705 Transcript_21940/m.45705 type:complete len:86 (+) Transcript_21940:2-259(+)